MARIVRHNDEGVREGYIRNGGKEVQLFTSTLKALQCNNRIVMAQRKHLDDFIRGRIIGRLQCGRTQLEVSEEIGIAQSVISRHWQRFQDDGVAAVAEWYRYRTVACLVMSSSSVPLKTRRVGQRCTLNLSRGETSSRWCGVVVSRGRGASSGVVHGT
ncbi:transposable element Tcb1 transposase [Trichonephila clavipes]|nr:transposable element Tcb1 transposase [Trichonephila clavipes]